MVEGGAGSLQEAVQGATDSGAANDTIALDPGDGSTFVLTGTLGSVSTGGNWIFDGSAQTGLMIDGSALLPAGFLGTGQNETVTLRDVGYTGRIDIGGPFVFDVTDPAGVVEVDEARGLLPELRKIGPGTTRITGDFDFSSLGLNGEFRVEDGTLEVAPTGSVTLQRFEVHSGATLSPLGGGTVAVGSFELFSGGTLAGDGTAGALAGFDLRGRVTPGGPGAADTLTLAGAPFFRSGSTLEIDLLPGDTGDTLAVTFGAPDIGSGAKLQLLADSGAFAAGESTTHTFLFSTDAPIQGGFNTVLFPAFFDTPVVVQDPNQITVTLTRDTGPGTFESLANTPNQRAVGRLLDDDTGGLADVGAGVGATPSNQVPELLDALGGETLTAGASARQSLAERSARALHRRARDPSWGAPRTFYAVDAPADDAELPDVALGGARVRPSAWLDAFGSFARFEGGNQGAADIDAVVAGATLGLDAWIEEEFVAGLAAGYARSEVRPEGPDHDLSADTIQAALYGGWSSPLGFASAYARYAYSFLDSVRDIESSAFDRRATADWNAQDWGLGAEAGATVLSVDSFGLQPVVGLDYLVLDEESYRESGAGTANLDVSPDTLTSFSTRVGARLFGQIDLDGEGLLTPELRAFWHHEFGDTDRRLDARLGGAPLRVQGAELPRDAAILGVGWSGSVGDAVTLFFDYDALLGSDRVEHQGTLSVRVRFF